MSNIVLSKYLEDTLTQQYLSNNVTTALDKVVATNNSAGTVVLSLYLVNSGGTADASNRLINRSILAGKSDLCPEIAGHDLDPNQTLWGQCDTASALAFRVTGRLKTS